MPPQSLDDMDGRGWEVRGWVVNGYIAGLVWEGLGCVGFVYEITVAQVLGLLCVERIEWVVHFDFSFPCRTFSKFWQFAFALDHICVVTCYVKFALRCNFH